jgi:hypothetical protein
MPAYGFDENSAKRIAHTVRLVEGSRSGPRSINGGQIGRAAVGARCHLGTISTAAWNKSSSANVTLYAGEPGSESSVETLSAYNYFADISTSTDTARWVAVSNNGFGWLLIAAECE